MSAARRLVPFLVAAVVTAVALGATWGSAIEVPGTETLNVNGAEVSTVTCVKAGYCAAGGEYTEASGGLDGSGAEQAFLVEETNGTWGTAIEVPGVSALNADGDARLFDIACPKPGYCAAAGFYRDGDGDGHGFLVNETNGVWGNAKKVPGVPAVSGGFSIVDRVVCFTVGSCAAAGGFDDARGNSHVFVVSETNGVWHKAVTIPKVTEEDAFTCISPGNCTAGGVYSGGCPCRAYVITETKGVWGKPQIVAGLAKFNHGPGELAGVYSLSCPKAGTCAAGGSYADTHDNDHPFVVDEKKGVWGKAIKVPGVAGAGELNAVSCSAAGSCAAGGYYQDSSQRQHAFVVSEKRGVWLTATKPANLGPYGEVDSIACATKTGVCVAGGMYADGSNAGQAFLVTGKNGVWQDAVEVPGTADLNLGGDAQVWSIFCTSLGSCVAGGFYRDTNHVLQAFVTQP